MIFGTIFDRITQLHHKLFKNKNVINDMNEKDKNMGPDEVQKNNEVPHNAGDDTMKRAETASQEDATQDKTAPMNNAAKPADADADKKCDDKTKHDKHHKGDKADEADGKVQEMGEKLAAINDKYVRLYSEYENYRKRTTLEKAELLLNGGKDVLKAILPIVDDMERALKNIPADNAAKEGVQLVYNKLMATLNQKGVKEIEAHGVKFDENLHEAVTRIPAAEEAQKGMIVDVIEKGYMMNDKVLRFPKVVVAF